MRLLIYTPNFSVKEYLFLANLHRTILFYILHAYIPSTGLTFLEVALLFHHLKLNIDKRNLIEKFSTVRRNSKPHGLQKFVYITSFSQNQLCSCDFLLSNHRSRYEKCYFYLEVDPLHEFFSFFVSKLQTILPKFSPSRKISEALLHSLFIFKVSIS